MVHVDFPNSPGGGEKKTDSWIHQVFVVVVVQGGATEGQKVKGGGLRVDINWVGRKRRTGGDR